MAWTTTADAFGRKVSETLPAVVGPDGYTQATPVQTWRYDELGRLDLAVDFNGDASTYRYDAQGRLAEEDLYLPGRVPGVDAPDRTVTYAYDQYDPSGDGSYSDSTTVVDAGVATVVTDRYDRRGDLVEVDSPQGSVHYEYDPAAGVKVRTWTGSDPADPTTDVRYAYDPFGRLAVVEAVRLDGAAVLQATAYAYNPDGSLHTTALPNGAVETRTYDGIGRLASIATTLGSNTLAGFAYSYDADGRLVEADLYSSGHAPGVDAPDRTYAYAYDLAGDRGYNYQSGDRLSNVWSNGGSGYQNYGYDANGDVNSISRDGQNLTLGYNTSGQLTSAQGLSGGTETYTYDAAGRLVRVGDAAGQYNRLVAPTLGGLESPFMITDGSNNLVADYVYIGGTPFMRIGADGQPVYYMNDAMGTVIGLSDGTGTSVARFTYDGFGNILSATGTAAAAPAGTAGDFRFHGAWLDTATGFYDMRARSYDPVTGRFLSRDPAVPDFTRPEDLNPYTFALNNPEVYDDPTGRFEVIEINISISMGDAVDGIQSAAINEAKNIAKQKIFEFGKDMLWGALNALVPQLEFINQLQSMRWLNKFAQGRWNQNQIVSEFAATLGVPSWLFLEVSMTKDGDPLNNGISSNNGANSENIVSLMNKAPIISNSKRPDFILGDNLPMTYNTNGKGTSWLVGDIKTSVVGMIHGYVNGYKTNPGSKLQFVAIANYAKKYTPGPIGLFICVKGGAPKVVLQSSLNDFIQLCISNAFAPVVVTLLGGTGKDADPVL